MGGDKTVPAKHDAMGWVSELVEGGALRAVVGKAVADAIGRLLGGVVEIPAASLEHLAQGIRDETAARSKVKDALAAAAAEKIIADPLLVERAARRWAGAQVRRQENLEAVAGATLGYLSADPPPQDGKGPSDDFMNFFEERASNASSAEMRDLYARILAGECRRPGAFSLGAIQVLSVMDQRLADAVQRVRGWVIDDDFILFTGSFQAGAKFADILLLADFGLLRVGFINKQRPIATDGKTAMSIGDRGYIVSGPAGQILSFEAALLTPVGKQIIQLADCVTDPAELEEIGGHLKSTPHVARVQLGRVTNRVGDTIHFDDLRDL